MQSEGKFTDRIRGTTRKIQAAAHDLRSNMTEAEAALWEAIRDKRLGGLRFRAQHPVGQFILDFYCRSCKLVIEIDGSVHDEQREQDEARTAHLNSFGYLVLRFRNEDVQTGLPSVLACILRTASSLTPPILGTGGVLLPGIGAACFLRRCGEKL